MITLLDRPPISGEYEEIFFEKDGPWRSPTWTYVLFTTNTGNNWVGHFRTGDLKSFKIAELPSKNIACIISGGHGYIIDIVKKTKIRDLRQDMILDLVADDETGSFYLSTFWSLLRVDDKFNEIDIDLPVGPDGIYFTDKIGRQQFLRIEEIGADLGTSLDYFIDLDETTINKSTRA